jgi:hypothetical protein
LVFDSLGDAVLRRRIEQRPITFVLLPSLNREICVAETVRRQIVRPFARPVEREEAVIETMRRLAEGCRGTFPLTTCGSSMTAAA